VRLPPVPLLLALAAPAAAQPIPADAIEEIVVYLDRQGRSKPSWLASMSGERRLDRARRGAPRRAAIRESSSRRPARCPLVSWLHDVDLHLAKEAGRWQVTHFSVRRFADFVGPHCRGRG